MSYPDAIYHGDSGEVSARLRPTDAPADLVYPNGTTVDYLATGASTDGRFGLYRWNMAPGPGGPDLHFHRTISETFFILSGTVTLGDGAKTVAARPGDYLYVPARWPAQLQERHRRTGLDAAAVLAGRPARGVLRGSARARARARR